jgi:hypothetical protein
MKSIFLMAFSCIFCYYVNATSIIPPKNIGELIKSTKYITIARLASSDQIETNGKTYTKFNFKIVQNINNSPDLKNEFSIINFSFSFKGGSFKASSDLEFQKDQEYLFFLNKKGEHFIPVTLDFGIFEVKKYKGKEYFVPREHYLDVAQIGNSTLLKLPIYEKNNLIKKIHSFISNYEVWDDKIAEGISLSSFYTDQRAAPSHCNFLTFQSKPFRWIGFPNNTVNIRYAASGDNTHLTAIADTKNAITETKNAYSGINVTDAGTHNYNPSCIGGSSLTDEYINFINSSYNSYRNILIIYNDPCNELADLINCTGIVAISGVFAISTHVYDGSLWNTASYGYLLMNNNVGPCVNSYLYKLIVEHELSHSLGFDHITSSTANMNPYCCYTINSLDIACVNYSYSPIVLPLEIESFSINQVENNNQLNWKIHSQFDYALELESATENKIFKTIFSSNSAPTVNTYIDNNENNTKYYRLKLTTQDKTTYSQILISKVNNKTNFFHKSNRVVVLEADRDLNMDDFNIISIDGSVVNNQMNIIQTNKNTLEISFHTIPGIYLIYSKRLQFFQKVFITD